MIAVSFFALAAYVSVDAVWSLLGGAEAEHSTVGLVLAGLSLLIMPGLSYAERRAGRELGSRSAVADSKQTLLCTYLSGVLLVGSGAQLRCSGGPGPTRSPLWSSPRSPSRGREAWRGDTCCAPTAIAAVSANPGANAEGADCDCCATGTGPANPSAIRLSVVNEPRDPGQPARRTVIGRPRRVE